MGLRIKDSIGLEFRFGVSKAALGDQRMDLKSSL